MAVLSVGVLTQLLFPLLQLNAQAAGLAAAASNSSLSGLGLNSMSTGDLRAPNSLSANDLRALGSHPSLWQAGQVRSPLHLTPLWLSLARILRLQETQQLA